LYAARHRSFIEHILPSDGSLSVFKMKPECIMVVEARKFLPVLPLFPYPVFSYQ